MVQLFQFLVVAQHIERGAVRLPQVLEPRREDLAVGARLRVFAAHRLQHQTFGRVVLLQIGHGRQHSAQRIRQFAVGASAGAGGGGHFQVLLRLEQSGGRFRLRRSDVLFEQTLERADLRLW
jgi:hypothetical protein